MKRLICICLLISMTLLFVSCGAKKVEYTSLGIPTDGKMMVGTPRTPWDMIFYDGMLYVGNGCYDDDAGPITVWRYDTSNGTWGENGIVPDEEVSRFLIIGGELVAPGIDPQGDWTLGNYYVLRDNVWETIRTIPGGVHNFDMVEYDGKLFAGLGVEPGNIPIAVSSDNGKTFESAKMIKDGSEIDTSNGAFIRVYDLFLYDGSLYAMFYMTENNVLTLEMYKYADGKFEYYVDLKDKIGAMNVNNRIVAAEAEFKGKFYFTTGYLFVTDNMNDFSHYKFSDPATVVYDIILKNDAMYILTGSAREDGTYEISVYENKTGKEKAFQKIFYFDYGASPNSFEYADGSFYIGIGSSRIAHRENGEVLKVDFSIE